MTTVGLKQTFELSVNFNCHGEIESKPAINPN